ncbi:MAG: M55 family metallopeptidase [Lentisphaeria bacterium]|nr:M55 family metallopeptidase [Lentisphaeria bacterium]
MGRKRIMVRCDIEGVSGVVSYEQAEPGRPEYAVGHRLFMADLLALIEGLSEGGTEEIVIYDEHYYGRNVDLTAIPEHVSVICGKPPYREDWAGGLDESFDGVVLLGFHSKFGTPDGLLHHSYELDIRDLRLNGVSVGEIGMEAAIAGDVGVPVLLVTGDSAGVIFASGRPSPEDANPADYAAFADLVRWLCAELKPHGITAQLEPFDTTIDKCFLYGPSETCARFVESLQPDVDNLGLELDVAHVPLMGETFDQAIRNCAPFLKRVHLGNCVLKDTSHPRYGDTHPPVGFPGGEIDVPELAKILHRLLDVGFLRDDRRGNLIVEMTPWPGKTVEETIADSFGRLDAAWAAL